jgi:hypothetical protein
MLRCDRSKRVFRALLLALGLTDSATPLAFAEPSDGGQLNPGSRIRVRRSDGRRLTGTLVSLRGGMLTLENRVAVGRVKKLERFAIPVAGLRSLEISHARSRKGRNAGIGFLSGAVIGGGVGYAVGTNQEPFCFLDRCAQFGPTPTEGLLFLGALGGLIGAGLGAATAPGERWASIDIGSLKLAASPAFGRGQVGARVTIGF